MKLKEKLANDYLEERQGPQGGLVPAFVDGLYDGFLAGFEKARAMAVEEFDSSLARYRHVEFQKAWASVLNDLENIGEEEV